MTHEISMDDPEHGFIAVNKFVTAHDSAGNIATLIHKPPFGKIPQPHDTLMKKLLVQMGIATGSPDAVSLRDHQSACIGGGMITGPSPLEIEWNSSTLRSAIGTDRPADEATATALIGEIRTWIEARLKNR
jgi:hypothetical protein